MTIEESKKWAELFTALSEGKTIERIMYHNTDNPEWIEVHSIDSTVDVYEYRIKPAKKTRRMTNQELSYWLRDEPQEHREIKKMGCVDVYQQLSYMEIEADKECGDVLIRHNNGEWEEPIIEVEE